MDAFDADVLIYAATPDHRLGRRVRSHLEHNAEGEQGPAGIGSVLLLPEVLCKAGEPGRAAEAARLSDILGRLDLRPVNPSIAKLATVFRDDYALKTVDAVHLATAVQAGAERFITNNRRDFSSRIEEIDIVFPDDLPDPEA